MSKQVIALIAVLMGSAAAAQAQDAVVDVACMPPAIAASSELQEIPDSDLMTVPVEINGRPKQFLLDVSSNATEISSATVEELGLTIPIKHTEFYQSGAMPQTFGHEGSASVGGTGMQISVVDVRGAQGSDDSRKFVGIESFAIGKATGHDLVFAVANSSGAIGTSHPYDGRMSGSFFTQYNVEMDFSAKKLNYLTPTNCTDPRQVVFWPHTHVAVLPMTISDGKIAVQVTIDGHPVDAILDTSSPHTVMRRDVAERLFGLKTGTPEVMPAGDLRDGLDMQIYTHTFPQISFAGVMALNVPTLIQANSMVYNVRREPVLGSRARFKEEKRIPDLTLGMDVLRQLHLYVVYNQDNIYVTTAK